MIVCDVWVFCVLVVDGVLVGDFRIGVIEIVMIGFLFVFLKCCSKDFLGIDVYVEFGMFCDFYVCVVYGEFDVVVIM